MNEFRLNDFLIDIKNCNPTNLNSKYNEILKHNSVIKRNYQNKIKQKKILTQKYSDLILNHLSKN